MEFIIYQARMKNWIIAKKLQIFIEKLVKKGKTITVFILVIKSFQKVLNFNYINIKSILESF